MFTSAFDQISFVSMHHILTTWEKNAGKSAKKYSCRRQLFWKFLFMVKASFWTHFRYQGCWLRPLRSLIVWIFRTLDKWKQNYFSLIFRNNKAANNVKNQCHIQENVYRFNLLMNQNTVFILWKYPLKVLPNLHQYFHNLTFLCYNNCYNFIFR